jgi:hypothetical protein
MAAVPGDLNLDSLLLRSPDVVFRNVAGEAVLVPIRKNVGDLDSIYTLNEVGACVWERLATPQTLGQLVEFIGETYEAPHDLLVAELSEFIHNLLTRKLIQLQK